MATNLQRSKESMKLRLALLAALSMASAAAPAATFQELDATPMAFCRRTN
jgi:hypothetical protein